MREEEGGLHVAGWEIHGDLSFFWLASQISHLAGIITRGQESHSEGSNPGI